MPVRHPDLPGAEQIGSPLRLFIAAVRRLGRQSAAGGGIKKLKSNH